MIDKLKDLVLIVLAAVAGIAYFIMRKEKANIAAAYYKARRDQVNKESVKLREKQEKLSKQANDAYHSFAQADLKYLEAHERYMRAKGEEID